MSTREMLGEILPEIISEFNKVIDHLYSLSHTPSVEEMEAACQSGMHNVSVRLMEAMIERTGMGYVGASTPCSCGRRAKFQGYRKKTVQTLVGTINFRRAYYYCSSCGEGACPIDKELGVTRKEMSKALERCVCRLSVVESFEDAALDIGELTGASVTGKTAQLVSESVGNRLMREAQIEAELAVKGEREIVVEESPRVLCIAMDGKMIPTTSGKHRELKVAAVYDLVVSENQETKRHDLKPGRTTYVGRFAEPDIFGELMWVEAEKRGAARAKRVVVLGDGARWIWNQAQTHYPEAVQILDNYHVKEHLWELGKALYGEGTNKTKRFVSYKLTQIDNGKVGKVITALSKLKITDAAKQEKVREEINYLQTNRKRMNYPLYRKKGYPIGSGVVESACKQFGARLDQAGMRWLEAGAGAIAALRALRLSGRWDLYWKPVRHPLLA